MSTENFLQQFQALATALHGNTEFTLVVLVLVISVFGVLLYLVRVTSRLIVDVVARLSRHDFSFTRSMQKGEVLKVTLKPKLHIWEIHPTNAAPDEQDVDEDGVAGAADREVRNQA